MLRLDWVVELMIYSLMGNMIVVKGVDVYPSDFKRFSVSRLLGYVLLLELLRVKQVKQSSFSQRGNGAHVHYPRWTPVIRRTEHRPVQDLQTSQAVRHPNHSKCLPA